ncbi:ABC transporter substrate-binding protein [Actinophytocola xanthii]|uniref:Sulfonate ABC transporter substrate-binding protein n=1 Tax=Actinophytocola xanthii TaxID=1912961 RepID=A0A1Q8CTM0_9PSEU|nr:ABC transporter substrate-binding protein [Actinophytocola xanthii]OLF17715.1 sulfonate ABC transporter substrate-binding protein [Actinophytocola xanthii]
MPKGSTGRGLRTRLPKVATTLTLVTALSSCGLLGGSDDETEPQSSGNGKLEKTELTISIMKTTDLTPFHLARKEGFFEEEGLSVKTVDAPSGNASVQKLLGGESDISYSSYTPLFLAESKGAAASKGGVKLVADAASAGPNSTMVVAVPDSPVKSVRDMANKRVAVTAPNTISDLLTNATLKTNGVDWKSVTYVPTPFPQTAQQLKSGNVDAAFVTEPWIVDTQRNAGAVPIFDTAVGPTADMPVAGWGALGDFVEKHPNTIAAFQRAMQRGTDLALSDRSLVEPLLVEFAGVDEQTAKMATLLTFQSKLEASRIQRVPDLMLEFEVIKTELDAEKMIVPTAPVT